MRQLADEIMQQDDFQAQIDVQQTQRLITHEQIDADLRLTTEEKRRRYYRETE